MMVRSFFTRLTNTIYLQDRALDPSSRFSATTTLTVNVKDSDDQDPKFSEELYTAEVKKDNGTVIFFKNSNRSYGPYKAYFI